MLLDINCYDFYILTTCFFFVFRYFCKNNPFLSEYEACCLYNLRWFYEKGKIKNIKTVV